MSTALVPVFAGEIAGASVQLVNARLLHGFLESAQHFADWIKNRITDYGFVQDQDFLVSQFYETKKGRGGNRKPVIDYHITIDMAKELSMVERTEKGRDVRRYFIDCERKLIDGTRNAIQDLPPTIAPHQQNALQVIVARKSGNNGAIRAMLWSRFNNHFKLGSYKQLPAERFDEAVTYLEGIQTAYDPARLPGKNKLYQYPKADLNRSEQGYPALLNIREMAHWSATSPTYRLLTEMQADGHNVEGPMIEWCAMMEAAKVADNTLCEIMHLAWERMGQPSRLAGFTV